MRYLVLVLFIAAIAGCETVHYHGYPQPGPPSHAPAHGYYKKHVYHYYPDAEIYFSVELGTYTVFQGGRWVVVKGRRPAMLTSAHKYVVIKADTKEPWKNHSRYKKSHPPGQPKQHIRGGKGRGKGGGK